MYGVVTPQTCCMWLSKEPTPKIIIPIYFYIILCMMKINNKKKVRETLQHARLKFQWNSWRNNRSNCACQFNDIFCKSVFSLTPDGYTIFFLLLFWVLFPALWMIVGSMAVLCSPQISSFFSERGIYYFPGQNLW